MTTHEKLIFTLVVAAWLFQLLLMGIARHIVADEYLHALPPGVTVNNLPASTKFVALPILAPDVARGVAKIPFIAYWTFLWVWPICVLAWMWRTDDRVAALSRWTIGMSLYAVFVVGSAVMIAFSLWLPTRT